MRNPPLKEGRQLKDWYYKHEAEIKGLIHAGAHTDINVLLPPPEDNEIMTIVALRSTAKKDRAGWIHGAMSLNPNYGKMGYTACQYCYSSLDGLEGWCLNCTNCGQKTQLTARCHLGVYIDDGTSSVDSVLFTPTAEKVTTFSASQLLEASEQHDNNLVYAIDEIVKQAPMYVFIKFVEKMFRGRPEESYQIVSVYYNEEVQQHRSKVPVLLGNSLESAIGGVASPAPLLLVTKTNSPRQEIAAAIVSTPPEAILVTTPAEKKTSVHQKLVAKRSLPFYQQPTETASVEQSKNTDVQGKSDNDGVGGKKPRPDEDMLSCKLKV